MKKIMLLLVCLIISPSLCFSVPLSEEDPQHIQKIKTTQHVLYETYLETDKGIASVFGYHFDMYFWEKTAFVLAIFGAVGGERGGYGIAAMGLNYEHALTEKLNWDTRALTGSGGGGGLDAGGGFMVEVQTGPVYHVTPFFSIEAKYGYLKFPTGSFESPIYNIGFSIHRNHLFLPVY